MSPPGRLAGVRRWCAGEVLHLRLDARRPASWIAAAACLAVGATLAAAPVLVVLPSALACGGLGAVAAVGAVKDRNAEGGLRWPGGARRAAWAVTGALVAAIVCRSWTPVAIALAAVLTAVAIDTVRRRGVVPADVSSLALAAALGVAGAVALVPESVRVPVAVVGWFVIVSALAWWSGHRDADVVTGGSWAGGGPTGELAWPAMVSTLAAMAVCYFLMPEHAAWYAVFAAGWFLCLAVPAATVAAGGRDTVERSLLVDSAPGRVAVPGTTSHGLMIVVTQAVILAWPAAVAAVLWGRAAFRADGPLGALGVLAALAVSTAAVGGLAVRHGHGETALAIIGSIAMAGVAMLARG